MAELLAHLARQLVEDPDAVEVEEVRREGATVLQLRVAIDELPLSVSADEPNSVAEVS